MLRFLAFLSLALWGIAQAKEVLIPLILSAMLALVLAPGVLFLKRLRVPDPLALLCATLVILLPLAAIVYEAVI